MAHGLRKLIAATRVSSVETQVDPKPVESDTEAQKASAVEPVGAGAFINKQTYANILLKDAEGALFSLEL